MVNFLYFIKKYILFIETYNQKLELDKQSNSDIYYKNICLLSNLNILTKEIIKNNTIITIQEFKDYKDFLNSQKISYFRFIQSSIKNELAKTDISKINLTEQMLNIESLVPTALTVYYFSNNSMCIAKDKKNLPLKMSQINDYLIQILNSLNSKKETSNATNNVKMDTQSPKDRVFILKDNTTNVEELDYI